MWAVKKEPTPAQTYANTALQEGAQELAIKSMWVIFVGIGVTNIQYFCLGCTFLAKIFNVFYAYGGDLYQLGSYLFVSLYILALLDL